MQVARGKKAALRWVGMDPTHDEQVLGVAVGKQVEFTLLGRVAGFRRGDLVGNDQVADEQSIADESSG